MSNSDLVAEIKYATRSAVYFWISNGLPELADEGFADSVVDKITAVINLKTDSYSARRSNFHAIWKGGLFDGVE